MIIIIVCAKLYIVIDEPKRAVLGDEKYLLKKHAIRQHLWSLDFVKLIEGEKSKFLNE